MIDVNRLCAGCMREKKAAVDVCPYCGFSLSDYQQNTRCLAINTILAGKYLVGRVLGQGGFGITYMGFDLNMETRVAIKEYFPVELVSRDTTSLTGDRVLSLSGDRRQTYQQGLEKYVKEAQNVSQFTDIPGVVSVKDFFYENETAYIVMEYIDGMSLKDYLAERGGRLPEAEALAIAKPVLEALVKVHKAGMIHRDISPDNIMLTFEKGKIASVRLIDFGAARMTAKNDQKSLTIILKHGYAPEEQYRTHGEQGPWTDVYAICAVLYRMLTGETPVPAMDRLFEDSLKDVSDYPVKVSKSTADAVIKGLAVKKEDRLSSVSELIGVLYEGKTVKKTKTHKTALIAGVAAGCVVVAAGIFLTAGGKTMTNDSSSQMVQEAADGQTAKAENLQSEELLDPSSTEVNGADLSEEKMVTFEQKSDEQEDFGEVIVTAYPQTSYASSVKHAVIRKEDGTVASLGSNQYGQRNLSEWTHIAAVAVGDTFSAGLRENGTVVVAGSLEGKENVERWTDIVAITANFHYLYGLTSDGKIQMNYLPDDSHLAECLSWENIKAFSAYRSTICGLTEDGNILCSWPVKSSGTSQEISGWQDVVNIATNTDIVVGLKSDGTLVASQLVTEDDYDYGWTQECLSSMQNLSDVVQMSLNYKCLCAVSKNGDFYIISGEHYKDYGFRDSIASWDNLSGIIHAVTTYAVHIAGIQKDGTILEWNNNYGNVSVDEMKDLKLVQIFDGDDSCGNTLAGITSDGQLVGQSFGSNVKNFFGGVDDKELLTIGDIKYYRYNDAGRSVYSYEIYSVDSSGKIWMRELDKESEKYGEYVILNEEPVVGTSAVKDKSDTGASPYIATLSETGKISLYKKGDLEIADSLYDAENWSDIRQVACCLDRTKGQSVILGLREDGTIVSVSEDGTSVDVTNQWTDIDSLYEGRYSVGAIRSDGTAAFLEDAPEYNYGQYNTYDWTDLTQLALGMFHTAGLRSDGTVYAVGRNDAGQCDVGDWTDIVYIAAGDSCTLGIKSDGSLVIAGDIGW